MAVASEERDSGPVRRVRQELAARRERLRGELREAEKAIAGELAPTAGGFDRKAYQRDYMRRRRALARVAAGDE